ncbi:ABC transporter ATP-binding protein [Isoptericola sp. AK164]|uniref:ABC transporter ATP-binding protein n=1 Tax=Isoptericola sp. AK164 TaxID=3024246 RepID=UPI002418505D|nr:ABC transporter ATP-binding protein [Isoptericola sp. AK164]
MITTRRLTVRYGRTVAVAVADLVAADGRTLGLIGPNGSGKSTMLRAVLGAVPGEGTVTVDDDLVRDLTPRQRADRIAVVAQEEPSGMPLTVRESVLLGRSGRRSGWSRYRPEDEHAAQGAMTRTGVTHLAHRQVDGLSGGERQRVLVARALAQGSSHLLLDEPTNHLDVRYQHEILSLVHGLPLTTITVLHDLNLAARYCDELVLLSEGHVVAAGVPAEVLVPEVLEPVYEIAVRRLDVEGVPQLVFGVDARGRGPGPRPPLDMHARRPTTGDLPERRGAR